MRSSSTWCPGTLRGATIDFYSAQSTQIVVILQDLCRPEPAAASLCCLHMQPSATTKSNGHKDGNVFCVQS